jgi:hypothetical protein
MNQGQRHLMRIARSIAALAIAVSLGACTGTSVSGPVTAGFPAGAGPAGTSQHANLAVASVRTIALADNAMLYWQSLPSGIPTSSTPPIINAFVSLSAAVSGVPCVNCVGSPPNPNALGIAFPQPYLPLGSLAEETYTFEDVSVSETCTLKFQFKQSGATLATYLFHNITIGPGVFFFFRAGTLPSNAVAGVATTTGDMVCPGVTTKPATETVYFF